MLINRFSIILIIFIGCRNSNNEIGPNEIVGCTNNIACNFNANATVNDDSCIFVSDACGVCGGEAVSNDECSTNWNIYYDVSDILAGFQFDITGVTVTDASGGAAGAAGFMVLPSASRVVGFSLAGNIIPAGSGLLIVLEFEGDKTSACILNTPTNPLIISDPNGKPIDAEIINCNTIRY